MSGGEIHPFAAPIPGRQRGEIADLVISDPSLRIDVIELAGLNRRQYDLGAFAACVHQALSGQPSRLLAPLRSMRT